MISGPFFLILLHNHIINKKKTFSGDVHYEAIFPLFFLLHKRAKPMLCSLLVRIKSIQICYQLLQTRPTGEKRYLLLQPTHPATDAMRGSVRCTARDAQADALRRSMRCELFAMQCAARGLVAFALCRRRHAFDGGILRVVSTF